MQSHLDQAASKACELTSRNCDAQNGNDRPSSSSKSGARHRALCTSDKTGSGQSSKLVRLTTALTYGAVLQCLLRNRLSPLSFTCCELRRRGARGGRICHRAGRRRHLCGQQSTQPVHCASRPLGHRHTGLRLAQLYAPLRLERAVQGRARVVDVARVWLHGACRQTPADRRNVNSAITKLPC